MPGAVRILVLIVALGLGVSLRAADKPMSPAETLAALKQEHKKAEEELDRTHDGAKTDEARRQAWAEYRTKRDAVAGRAVEMARKYPKDPAALEALIWVTTSGLGWGKEQDAAIDVLAADHINSDKLEMVCLFAGLMRESKPAEHFLQTILEKSPHRSLRGVACLSLGRRLKDATEEARYRKSPDAEKLENEAAKYYERVMAEFPDFVVKEQKIGDRARNALFAMRNLVIGRPVPDIEGEDLDGKKFKLSDYRGKVVVLDFWGNW
jgi:hypothetical protein